MKIAIYQINPERDRQNRLAKDLLKSVERGCGEYEATKLKDKQ